MKMTTGILGCALVAGLMTFAPSQSQAGVVGTDGVLYSPLSLKLTINKVNSNDKITKETVTSKEVLKDLGYSSDVVLAVAPNEDIVVINKKSGAIINNLSSNEVMWLNTDEFISTSKDKGNNGGYEDKFSGLVDIHLYFDGDTFDRFDISGSYSGSEKGSSIKNGQQNINTKSDSKNLSGDGYFSEIYEGSTVVTGSASIKGNGKIAVAL